MKTDVLQKFRKYKNNLRVKWKQITLKKFIALFTTKLNNFLWL